MKHFILVLSLIIAFYSCKAQDCSQMPYHFDSYEDAVAFVKNATFQFTDDVNTSKSSWIRSASYYSCDGETGFFIFSTDENEYIHAGVPVTVWKQFKEADSFGRFYNENIKGRYHFDL